ncbi:MAG TPA: hypothetical protein VGO99_02390, partial [Leifsonia sp.]|nr:hypothetical protein [Leifsonia sp.]
VASDLRAAISAEGDAHPEDLFAYVYETPTPQLREQAAMLAAELASDSSDSDSSDSESSASDNSQQEATR